MKPFVCHFYSEGIYCVFVNAEDIRSASEVFLKQECLCIVDLQKKGLFPNDPFTTAVTYQGNESFISIKCGDSVVEGHVFPFEVSEIPENIEDIIETSIKSLSVTSSKKYFLEESFIEIVLSDLPSKKEQLVLPEILD